jgi:hypothetical protein
MVCWRIVRVIVCTSVPVEEALQQKLAPRPLKIMNAASQLEAAIGKEDKPLVFLDATTLEVTPSAVFSSPVVAVSEGSLQDAVAWLRAYPLSHVISANMLRHPIGSVHLGNLVAAFEDGPKPRLIERIRDSVSGRRVSLIAANRRVDRIERMSEFFAEHGVGERTNQLLRDVAEELLTNAFYDAPAAAGASKPIARTVDVTLPDESPCDMSYGCSDDFAIVHVRDPFGALTRSRIVEVLVRCARTDMRVEVDESMGGAGLGLWRIFSAASFVAISVVEGHHTDVLVGLAKKSAGGQRPYAFHLFFRKSGRRRRWRLTDEHAADRSFVSAVEPHDA